MDAKEVRIRALRLAIEFYRGKDISFTTLEAGADKFEKYINLGMM